MQFSDYTLEADTGQLQYRLILVGSLVDNLAYSGLVTCVWHKIAEIKAYCSNSVVDIMDWLFQLYLLFFCDVRPAESEPYSMSLTRSRRLQDSVLEVWSLVSGLGSRGGGGGGGGVWSRSGSRSQSRSCRSSLGLVGSGFINIPDKCINNCSMFLCQLLSAGVLCCWQELLAIPDFSF